ADHQCIVVAPGEVLLPASAAWMVERHTLLAHRIIGIALIVFVIVATLAGQRQILQHRGASTGLGDDMLDREGLGGILCLALAIFATTACAFDDLPAHLRRHPLLRHRAVQRYPASS